MAAHYDTAILAARPRRPRDKAKVEQAQRKAPTDADLLSVLIDDAQAGHDPHTVLSLYTAPPELNPFDEQTIKLANPAYGTFLNPAEVLAMAENARRMPSREAEYRNLILNQRIETSNTFIAPARGPYCSCAARRSR